MDVRARGVARRAGIGDDLALRDGLARRNGEFLIVAVQRRQAVAVVDDDGIAIAADPAGFDDGTAIGCLDGRAIIDADIDAAVVDGRPKDGMSPVTVRRRDDAVDGPDHGSRPAAADGLGIAAIAAVRGRRRGLGRRFFGSPLAQLVAQGLGSLLIFGIGLLSRGLIVLGLVEDSLLFVFMGGDFVALGLRFIAQLCLAVALYF